MNKIYIKTQRSSSANCFDLELESLIVVFVYKNCQHNKLELVLIDGELNGPIFETSFDGVKYEHTSHVTNITTYCKWPVIVIDETTVIAGLSSVLRQIVRSSDDMLYLLGFREACLMACSETSVWTKFCEVDIVETTKQLLNNENSCQQDDLLRYEYHLMQPVKVHNLYKLAREKNKDKTIKNGCSVEKLNLKHAYAEGCTVALSDYILYVCYDVIFQFLRLYEQLPLTKRWYDNMAGNLKEFVGYKTYSMPNELIFVKNPEIKQESLYKSDPKRYNPQSRPYTKQNDVENAIRKIVTEVTIKNTNLGYGDEFSFDWSTLPADVDPEGGALPKKRAGRKREQLTSVANAVFEMARNKNGYVIVDFCSGSGHLGILLASILPNCKVILIENKERSLARAKLRVEKLGLTNTILLQCNLGYFIGNFDVGVSLHACGVATDLVIKNCIDNKAHFVTCPCCYGGIRNCDHVTYPKSLIYTRLLEYNMYLNLAHGADQTHGEDNAKTNQGYKCMDIIDTDRQLHAEEVGYRVYLGKLTPLNCTPKNNLLVGLFQKRISR